MYIYIYRYITLHCITLHYIIYITFHTYIPIYIHQHAQPSNLLGQGQTPKEIAGNVLPRCYMKELIWKHRCINAKILNLRDAIRHTENHWHGQTSIRVLRANGDEEKMQSWLFGGNAFPKNATSQAGPVLPVLMTLLGFHWMSFLIGTGIEAQRFVLVICLSQLLLPSLELVQVLPLPLRTHQEGGRAQHAIRHGRLAHGRGRRFFGAKMALTMLETLGVGGEHQEK